MLFWVFSYELCWHHLYILFIWVLLFFLFIVLLYLFVFILLGIMCLCNVLNCWKKKIQQKSLLLFLVKNSTSYCFMCRMISSRLQELAYTNYIYLYIYLYIKMWLLSTSVEEWVYIPWVLLLNQHEMCLAWCKVAPAVCSYSWNSKLAELTLAFSPEKNNKLTCLWTHC